MCYCSNALDYEQCCKPLHLSLNTAKTAQDLMRSRYSAFVCKEYAYLQKTTTVATPLHELQNTCENVVYNKLELISTKAGKEKDKKGKVEFKAYYTFNNEEHILHEISSFKKVNGEWMYVSGVIL